MIKVSVIVAVYNAEKYLEKCIGSLLCQTLEEIEIIAVDDGSIDSSPAILAEFAKTSIKVKCYTRKNGGAADARNFGLTLARGEFIGYIDSDDFADPDMYEIMYNTALEHGSDIVECNLHHTYANSEDTEVMAKYYTPGELLTFGRYVVWNKIYRRELLIEANASFPVHLIYEDVAFLAKLAPYIKSYAYVNIAPVHYVQRDCSVNNSKSKKTMDIFAVLKDVLTFYKENGFYGQYKYELEYLFVRILLCSSFKRMCRITDRALRKNVLLQNFKELNDTFPNWRKNPVLKIEKGWNALFMKAQTPLIYRISCAVFPALFNKRSIVT